MTWFIGQSIVIIAAAFLLGLLVGWLIWGRISRTDRSSAGPAAVALESETRPALEPEPVPAAAEPLAVTAVEPEPQPEPVAVEPQPQPQPEPEPVAVEPEPEPVAPIAEVAPAHAESAPEQAEEAAGGVLVAQAVAPPIEQIAEDPDDLERIEGIGPKMAGALLKSGIRTYAQLAAADQAALRRAIEADGLKFAPSIVTWSRQAQLLADGDEAGFEDLTRRLVAGRDEGRE